MVLQIKQLKLILPIRQKTEDDSFVLNKYYVEVEVGKQ